MKPTSESESWSLLRFEGALPYVGAEPVPLKFWDGTVVALTVLKKPPNERKTGRRRGSDAVTHQHGSFQFLNILTSKRRKIDVTDCPYLVFNAVPGKIFVKFLIECKSVDDCHQGRGAHRKT